MITASQELILTATNSCGTDTDVIYIREEDCSASDSIFIPNVITPNNDGLNDVFEIDGTGILSISGTIYNRWGKILFEWNDLDTNWTGDDNSEGTYFYVIDITFKNDEPKTFKGSIVLFK
jgi:gliding motility-associated-like protein